MQFEAMASYANHEFLDSWFRKSQRRIWYIHAKNKRVLTIKANGETVAGGNVLMTLTTENKNNEPLKDTKI